MLLGPGSQEHKSFLLQLPSLPLSPPYWHGPSREQLGKQKGVQSLSPGITEQRIEGGLGDWKITICSGTEDFVSAHMIVMHSKFTMVLTTVGSQKILTRLFLPQGASLVIQCQTTEPAGCYLQAQAPVFEDSAINIDALAHRGSHHVHVGTCTGMHTRYINKGRQQSTDSQA